MAAKVASMVQSKQEGQRKRSTTVSSKDGSASPGKSLRASASRPSERSARVSRGWVQQNITEVENLYSSRFRSQAEARSLNGTNTVRTGPKGKGKEQDKLQASSGPAFYSNYESGAGGLVIQHGPDEQPRAFFAEPAPTQDHPFTFVPAESYIDDTRRLASTPQMDDFTNSALPQPSPSMYAYLASPIINNASPAVRISTAKPQMATITEDTASINNVPTFHVSQSTSAQQNPSDAWKAYTGGVPATQPVQFQQTGPVVLENRFPQYHSSEFDTHMSGNTGQFHQHQPLSHYAQNNATGLLPAAGIQAIKQPVPGTVSHSNNGSFSYPMDPGSPAFTTMFANSHRRNLSHGIRGEYSTSNVTMADLDSHFGDA